MKGNERVIEQLNSLLAEELTATNQYMVHAEMCANWHYERLHKAVQDIAIQEMKHAEDLIERILFLEGQPIVNKLRPIHIGADVPAQLENDRSLEASAIKDYNDAIQVCVEARDNGSKMLLEAILKDEEAHIDWQEAQLTEIEQIGIQNYLVEQMH